MVVYILLVRYIEFGKYITPLSRLNFPSQSAISLRNFAHINIQEKMKKVVLKLELHDDKGKQKAMKTVSSLSGIESIAMDMKDKKLTLTGDVDPVTVVAKLRKLCHTEIVTVGPAKEEKKKEDPKKDEAKKADDKKKDAQLPYYQNPHFQTYPYPAFPPYYRNAEEDPNSCVIC